MSHNANHCQLFSRINVSAQVHRNKLMLLELQQGGLQSSLHMLPHHREKIKKTKKQCCFRTSPCLNSSSPSPKSQCSGRSWESLDCLAQSLCIRPWGRRKNRLSTSQDDAKNNTVPFRDQGNKGCEGIQSVLLPTQTSISATANYKHTSRIRRCRA